MAQTLNRRTPQQARSRFTVLTILVAAARLIQECGHEKLSTNRVARLAGVSVGSLYQYFKDKADLLGQLELRRAEVMERELSQRLRRAATCEEQLSVASNILEEFSQVEAQLAAWRGGAAGSQVSRLLEAIRGALGPHQSQLLLGVGRSHPSSPRAVFAGAGEHSAEALQA